MGKDKENSFESNLQKLESIVDKLESGEEILRRMDEIHDLEGFSSEEVEIPVISTI